MTTEFTLDCDVCGETIYAGRGVPDDDVLRGEIMDHTSGCEPEDGGQA